jgi:hypothetical protein
MQLPVSGKIFISYRRDDAAGYAGRIYDRLNARFPNAVFMDVSGIEPGADFLKTIEEKVSACETLIVLIGRHWLVDLESGKKRLNDPDDIVRLEIVTALKHNIPVLPVLLRGALMPTVRDLPDEIAPLALRHALEIADEDFDHDIRRLITFIKLSPNGGMRRIAIGGAALLLVAVGAIVWFFNHQATSPTATAVVPTPSPVSPLVPKPPDGGLWPTILPKVTPTPEVISGQPASAEVRDAIRKIYDRRSEGYTKKDLKAIYDSYAPDYVARGGNMVINLETASSNTQNLFAMGVSPTETYDIKDVIMTAPDTAVVTVKAEEDLGFMRGSETVRDTWKRIRDQWLQKERIVLDMH